MMHSNRSLCASNNETLSFGRRFNVECYFVLFTLDLFSFEVSIGIACKSPTKFSKQHICCWNTEVYYIRKSNISLCTNV
jgi:hypothetical protein